MNGIRCADLNSTAENKLNRQRKLAYQCLAYDICNTSEAFINANHKTLEISTQTGRMGGSIGGGKIRAEICAGVVPYLLVLVRLLVQLFG